MKQEDIDKVLQEILSEISIQIPQYKFNFQRRWTEWNVYYDLFKDDKKQDISIPYNFVVDVLLGLYPVNELIFATMYELNRQNQNPCVS
jgi:hypothetical protein